MNFPHRDPKMRKLVLFFTFCAFIMNVINAQSELSEEDLIKTLFNDKYNQKIRPVNSTDKQGPVHVAVNMYVRTVGKIDDMENDFDVQLTYRQKWRDERLVYKAGSNKGRPYLNLINPSSLTWLPDTFFSNEKEASYHNLMVRNEYVRVFPNGDIIHSARLSLKLSCPMNFRYFPFDEQTCSIRLASYGYTNIDVDYRWDEPNPIQVTTNIHLPTFNLDKFITERCDSTTNTGTYSCLKVNFTFKRDFSPYLINVYIPCVMMIIVAYLSFWIDSRAILARIILVVATLFTCATQISELNQTFPTTSYTKAVDVWTGICLTFIFGALVEIIVVQYLEQGENDQKSETTGESVGDEEEVKLSESKGKSEKRFIQKLLSDSDSVSGKIESASRVAYPATFVMFVIIYSFYYCLRSSSQ